MSPFGCAACDRRHAPSLPPIRPRRGRRGRADLRAAPLPETDDLECVYTVRFSSVDLFGDRSGDGEPPYVLLIDLWERYLEAATDDHHSMSTTSTTSTPTTRPRRRAARSEMELRAMALEAALTEKGLVGSGAIDELIETFEHRMGPHHGARRRPRVDRHRLQGATAGRRHGCDRGARDLRPRGSRARRREHRARPQPGRVHALLLLPWPLLGMPPIWYKSFAHRSRAVAERAPCSVSSASNSIRRSRCVCGLERRGPLLRVAERAWGTDDLTEEQLAALVTRLDDRRRHPRRGVSGHGCRNPSAVRSSGSLLSPR